MINPPEIHGFNHWAYDMWCWLSRTDGFGFRKKDKWERELRYDLETTVHACYLIFRQILSGVKSQSIAAGGFYHCLQQCSILPPSSVSPFCTVGVPGSYTLLLISFFIWTFEPFWHYTMSLIAVNKTDFFFLS